MRNGQAIVEGPRRPKAPPAALGYRFLAIVIRESIVNELTGSQRITMVTIGCLPGDNFDKRREVQHAPKGSTSEARRSKSALSLAMAQHIYHNVVQYDYRSRGYFDNLQMLGRNFRKYP